MERIRVLIVDDHEVVRIGLKTLLSRVGDLEVVGEAASAAQAEAEVERVRPDVVVMDIRMPGESGIEACRVIRSRFPAVRVIMLTSYSNDEAVFGSVLAGASGYVLKQIGSQELVEAIRRVHRGESLLDPSVTGRVLERLREDTGSEAPKEKLTEQETKILALISEGKTNKEIAASLYLSEKTVRNYVSNILGKLQLANRAEAAAYAVRRGLAGRDPEHSPKT